MVNMQSILDQLEKMKESENSTRTQSSGTSNFGTYEIVFLSSLVGRYEIRLFTDTNSKLTSSLYMHSIPSEGGRKITAVCKDDCELCKLYKQLNDNGDVNSWRYRRYHLNKFIIKTGNNVTGTLKPNTVYLAYVGNKLARAIMHSLDENMKYFKADFENMFNYQTTAGGFVINAENSGMSKEFTINFIQALQIPGFDPIESFGSPERMNLDTLGPFQKDSSNNDEKYKSAISVMRNRILETSSTEAEVPQAVDISNKIAEVKAAENKLKVESSSANPIQPTFPTPEAPVTQPTETPKAQGSDDIPECFGNYSSSEEKCKKCHKLKDCIMKQMSI